MSDSRVQEVVEIAAGHPGTAVFVHCGVLSVGVRRKLGLPSKFDLRLGDPLGVARLALAYPNLPFIIPHFGAGLFREALMAADTCANVHLDTSSSNSWMRYTPGLTLETVFTSALSVAGARRLLFGTDSSFFPRGWQRAIYDAQKASLDAIGVPAGDQALILGGKFRSTLSCQGRLKAAATTAGPSKDGLARFSKSRSSMTSCWQAQSLIVESLGTGQVEGVSAEGTRITTTIPAGQIGI
jgi:hypothetical protein